MTLRDATLQSTGAPAPGHVVWLGTDVDYGWAWEAQRRVAADRAEGRVPDTLLLVEHAPVYTAGRRSLDEHLLAQLPAPLVETDRGGQVTYHGPGQLVGYPVIALAARGLGPRAYLRALEAALMDVLAAFGIDAHTEDGLTGVWAGDGKIAAIGIRITRGVSLHGFALNVSTDLTAFDVIVPCGIVGRSVTSMTRVLGAPVEAVGVRRQVAEHLGRRLGIAWSSLSTRVAPT